MVATTCYNIVDSFIRHRRFRVVGFLSRFSGPKIVYEKHVWQVRGFLMETIRVSVPKITENYQKCRISIVQSKIKFIFEKLTF